MLRYCTVHIQQRSGASLGQLSRRRFCTQERGTATTTLENGSQFPATDEQWGTDDDATTATTRAAETAASEPKYGLGADSAVDLRPSPREHGTSRGLAGQCVDPRAYEHGIQSVSGILVTQVRWGNYPSTQASVLVYTLD